MSDMNELTPGQKLGTEPVAPHEEYGPGLTKRELLAGLALGGYWGRCYAKGNCDAAVEDAIASADGLLDELAKGVQRD